MHVQAQPAKVVRLSYRIVLYRMRLMAYIRHRLPLLCVVRAVLEAYDIQ
jgi:hypothetical protein